MGDGRTYWLGRYEVEIVFIRGGWVNYRYLDPSETMTRSPDGNAYGKIAVAAFAAQNRRGRG